MPEIKTQVTTKKWVDFKESELSDMLAASLGLKSSEVLIVEWPMNLLVETYHRENPEKHLRLWLK